MPKSGATALASTCSSGDSATASSRSGVQLSVDGAPNESMHLGLAADIEVTGETSQFGACACGRLMSYVLRGVIAKHLQRNAMIEKSEKEARDALVTRYIKKRPAARVVH